MLSGSPEMKTIARFAMDISEDGIWVFQLKRLLCPAPIIILLLGGCARRAENVQPAIEFTTVPPKSAGGTNTHGRIAGRVVGSHPGQQIVLYARAGAWWIQPVVQEPFVKIRSDNTWESPTHLGSEYAAILVDPGYKPQNVIDNLPGQGGQIKAIASVRGRPNQAAQSPVATLQFSGYQWSVRAVPSGRNGPTHDYDPANANVDTKGALHLRLTNRQGKWICSEVTEARELGGYGTYLVTVKDVAHFEPATIFSAFTWDELPDDPNHREMDVEVSRWGEPVRENGRFILQPFYVPANVSRFIAPPGELTFVLRREPRRALFQAFRGGSPKAGSHPIAEHVFTAGVPTRGHESLRMNFCSIDNHPVHQQRPSEIVIENLQFLP